MDGDRHWRGEAVKICTAWQPMAFAVRDGVVMPARRRHMCAEQGLEQGRYGRFNGFAEKRADWDIKNQSRKMVVKEGRGTSPPLTR